MQSRFKGIFHEPMKDSADEIVTDEGLVSDYDGVKVKELIESFDRLFEKQSAEYFHSNMILSKPKLNKKVSTDSGKSSPLFSELYRKNQFTTSLNQEQKDEILKTPKKVSKLWSKWSSQNTSSESDSAYSFKIGRFMSERDSGVEKSQYTSSSDSNANSILEHSSIAGNLSNDLATELEDINFDDLEVVPVKMSVYRSLSAPVDARYSKKKIKVNAQFVNMMSKHMLNMTKNEATKKKFQQVIRISATGLSIGLEKRPLPLNMRFIEFMSKTISRLHADSEVKCITGSNQQFVVKHKNKTDILEEKNIKDEKHYLKNLLRRTSEKPVFVENQGLLFKVVKRTKSVSV